MLSNELATLLESESENNDSAAANQKMLNAQDNIKQLRQEILSFNLKLQVLNNQLLLYRKQEGRIDKNKDDVIIIEDEEE
eukprot:CAMPEP_0116909946 /NCGR_PEP_ID=MMETSP0467-20121206/14583_1 /TAXON_ID=283647 /ORGANISM="Mesodinium pulex, Strain SPMC105" /LENGTH=79 /DNA_ID=CAMNT_0004585411 /DNA_START=2014 /DNA_END=2253 /DNA_ORIENTATION=-